MIAKKSCRACGKRLSLAAFNGSAKTSDGLANTCRACANARRREHYRSGVTPPRGHARSTVIAAALRQGDARAIQTLVDAGTTPRWDWICETMREGHLAIAEMLLKFGVERNVFTMAAMGDSKRLAGRLRRVPADARLRASMEPTSSRATPLHMRRLCSALAGLRKTLGWSAGSWTTEQQPQRRVSRLHSAIFSVTAERHTTLLRPS